MYSSDSVEQSEFMQYSEVIPLEIGEIFDGFSSKLASREAYF